MVLSIRRTLLRSARTPIFIRQPLLRAFTVSALRPRQHHREFDENGPYARQRHREQEREDALAEENEFEEYDEYHDEYQQATSEPPVYETLEQLSNSGRVDPPLLPVRPIHYKLPYNVDSYRQRQRVWEGNDAADPSSSTALFTDIKIIRLGSGKGGDGKVSFFRDSGRSRGPPDGGDGGDGGSVYIQAVSDETSLHKLRYHYRAEDGRPGAMASLNGRAGKDTLLQVPVGTVVKWIPDPKESFAEWKAKKLELTAEGKSANLRELNVRVDVVTDEFDRDVPLGIKLPRHSYADGEGWIFRDKNETYHTERDYFNELRDLGTISLGLARPSFTVADIPGIIRGARAENKGMGLDFLRHIERSGGLVFVISLEQKNVADDAAAAEAEITSDMKLPSTAGTGSVVGDLELLVDELGPERMSDKRVLVVGTKADLPGSEENFRLLKAYCNERGWACIPCCAQRKENVDSVIELMGQTAGKA
ncbi:hypothetical protein D0Z03_002828 [Geotrichum reessii]|nr:hypothetical protein D0Z03_002828 [Galactomyces reessii]